MGITSKKQKDIPKEFETIPAFDNTVRDAKTGIGIPSDEAVDEIKAYMNINKQ